MRVDKIGVWNHLSGADRVQKKGVQCAGHTRLLSELAEGRLVRDDCGRVTVRPLYKLGTCR